jgi:hypothetical protein
MWCMKCENIKLCERSQTQKATYYVIDWMKCQDQASPQKQKDWWFPRIGARETRGGIDNGYVISFRSNELCEDTKNRWIVH